MDPCELTSKRRLFGQRGEACGEGALHETMVHRSNLGGVAFLLVGSALLFVALTGLEVSPSPCFTASSSQGGPWRVLWALFQAGGLRNWGRRGQIG